LFEFKITKEFEPYVLAQQVATIHNLKNYSQMSESEYETVKSFISGKKSFLELGCGLGRMSIYCASQIKNHSQFILADSTGPINKFIRYGWNPTDGFYNDLNLTRKFAQLNNLEKNRIFDLNNEDLLTLSNIDVVMSFGSVGYHFPIEPYMEKLLKITKSDCVMIFGLSTDAYSQCPYTIESFKENFEKVSIVKNYHNKKYFPDYPGILEYLILENKIENSSFNFRDDVYDVDKKNIIDIFNRYLKRQPVPKEIFYYLEKIRNESSLEWLNFTIKNCDEAKQIQKSSKGC
jgi:SAM-dependent methyltransferase